MLDHWLRIPTVEVPCMVQGCGQVARVTCLIDGTGEWDHGTFNSWNTPPGWVMILDESEVQLFVCPECAKDIPEDETFVLLDSE